MSTEMDLVKNHPIQPISSEIILKNREKVTNAMNTTVKKMEMVMVISTLCHHTTEHDNFRRKKLQFVLGQEGYEILEELVTCHKILYGESSSDLEMEEIIGSEWKLRTALKYVDEFLMEVKSRNESQRDETVHISSVDLLREVISSKYKFDVGRYINEMDFKSLLNILYLTYEDSKVKKGLNEKECFDKDIKDIKAVIVFDGNIGNGVGIKDDDSPLELGQVEITCLDDDLSKETSFTKSKDDNFEMLKCELVEKVIKLKLKLIAVAMTLKLGLLELLNGNIEWNGNGNALGLKHFLECFYKLQLIFKCRDAEDNGLNYSRNLIKYELLIIEEGRLEKAREKSLKNNIRQSEELSETISRWTEIVQRKKDERSSSIKSYIKEGITQELLRKRQFQSEISELKSNLKSTNGSLTETMNYVKQITKSLRGRRHYLEASLNSLIRDYNFAMQKYQVKLDELQLEVEENEKRIAKIQKRFKNVEENYDEMRAMRRLKELLKNMEKAESIKQNWAARKIQIAWRKYKLAKLRKKKLKGKKKGKKKTPPPQQKGASPPSKAGSTPATRSRSKSQTP